MRGLQGPGRPERSATTPSTFLVSAVDAVASWGPTLVGQFLEYAFPVKLTHPQPAPPTSSSRGCSHPGLLSPALIYPGQVLDTKGGSLCPPKLLTLFTQAGPEPAHNHLSTETTMQALDHVSLSLCLRADPGPPRGALRGLASHPPQPGTVSDRRSFPRQSPMLCWPPVPDQ